MTDIPPAISFAPEDLPSGDTRERRDLACLVARNHRKFMPIYDARVARRRWVPFCWPGFLFPQAWFLYRKMYFWAGLAAAGPLLASQLFPYAVLAALPISSLGLFGRALYVRDSVGVLARIRAIARDDAEADDMIARAGGVSPLGAAIGALFAVASLILTAKGHAPMSPMSHL